MRADRPLVFLDVDGPLIPFGADARDMPDGYPVFGQGFDNPLLARVDPRLGERLRQLPAELVWATTWGEEANESIAPLLGLEPLPVVPWPDPAQPQRAPARVHWKVEPILECAGERPMVWLDDEISAADRSWVEASRSAPSLLHRVDGRFGLRNSDFDELTEWFAALGH